MLLFQSKSDLPNFVISIQMICSVQKKIRFWLPYAISMVCAFLMVYAATSKLWDFQRFKVQLGQSPVLTAYVEWVAWSVPLTEYILALLLLIDTTREKALFGFLGLMTMFTTYIVIVLNFSDYVPVPAVVS